VDIFIIKQPVRLQSFFTYKLLVNVKQKFLFHQKMYFLLIIYNIKIYIKISNIRSYMFRSTWTIFRELVLGLVKVTLL